MNMEYEINGASDQVLQVVLAPQEYLYADCNTVSWLSENIKIRRLDSMFTTIMGTRSDGIHIMNATTTPAFVGLNQQQGGSILVLNFADSVTKGIYCFKESFICASPNTTVVAKKLPFSCKNKTLLCHIYHTSHVSPLMT